MYSFHFACSHLQSSNFLFQANKENFIGKKKIPIIIAVEVVSFSWNKLDSDSEWQFSNFIPHYSLHGFFCCYLKVINKKFPNKL